MIPSILPSFGSRSRSVIRLMLMTVLVVLVGSCRPQLPEGVLSEGRMERILFDYHMAQGVAEQTTPDTGNVETYRYELLQAVFKKHGITEEEFEQSMSYYCSDLQRLNKIYRRLERRFEREANAFGQTRVQDVYADLSAFGDTANVWGGRPLMVVRNTVQENIQTWKQSCDSTWMPGDEVIWRFMPVSFSPHGYRTLTADLVVLYTNDSIRSAFRYGTPRTQMEIRVANPEGWTPQAIIGHLYTSVGRDQQDMAVLAATNVMLIRLHMKQPEKLEALPADSISVASLATDSVEESSQPVDDRRLSPEEFRRQQPVDQKIDIVKEKPYERPRQRGRRRMQQHLVPQRQNSRR